MTDTATATDPARAQFAVRGSRGLVDWLVGHHVGIAFTSYQTGRLWMMGAPRAKLGLQEQAFTRALGLALDGQSLWLASQAILWRLQDVLRGEPQGDDPVDRVYQAKTAHIIGDLDAHELGVMADGRIIFVNTRYSCLATLSDGHSFKPVWQPAFISRLAAEDRCHLNGLAMADGAPAYVTACARSDIVDGWRDRRRDGGLVVDVRTDQVLAEGLSMPHSPRIGPDGRVWLLESGRGQIVAIDPVGGEREDIVFCPGFLRGLAFHDGFAIVTVSKPRDLSFRGLELDDALKARDAEPACAVFIIDMHTRDVVESLRFDTQVDELFDVIAIPSSTCPMSLGPTSPHLGSRITIEDA